MSRTNLPIAPNITGMTSKTISQANLCLKKDKNLHIKCEGQLNSYDVLCRLVESLGILVLFIELIE